MEFTYATFKSSFTCFRKNLESQNLGLNLSSAQNLWGEIVLGKKYSAATAALNRHGSLKAKNISGESIRSCLKTRSREVDLKTAESLFTLAVIPALPEICSTMWDVSRILQKLEKTCVITTLQGDIGIGILRANEPGYIPIETLRLQEIVEGEFSWMKINSDITVRVINSAAGIDDNTYIDIFFANTRESDKKSERAFLLYFSTRVTETAGHIADTLIEEFDIGEGSDDSFDYDEVRDEIEHVFHRLSQKRDWIKPDCNIAETMIDNLTARLRETMKWLGYPSKDYSSTKSNKESLKDSAELTMRKFFESAGYPGSQEVVG